MTIPANLFIEAPEMQDQSLSKLSNEAETWPEEIIQRFVERVPQSKNMNAMVKFMKKDEENGAATGSIVVTAPDKDAVVPVIIKDFYLYPLDVMIAGGKILPLTSDYFDAFFSKDKGLFEKLEEYPAYGGIGRFDDTGGSLWNAVYPPNTGRYSYASAGYPILDEISETINGGQFKQWLNDNPGHLVNFKKHGHLEVISKVAKLQAVNMNEFRQGADNLIKKNIVMLRKEGPNKYSLLASTDKAYSPSIHKMDRNEVLDFMSSQHSEISGEVCDVMNEVDQNGEKILKAPEPYSTVILAGPEDVKVEKADSFDHYTVMNSNGVMIEGMVIPKVIGFDQKPVDLKIFVGKTMSAIQPEIYGVRLKNSRFSLDGAMPQLGQTGTFVYQPDRTHALATIPVTVKSVTVDCHCGGIRLKVEDFLGRPFQISVPSFEGRSDLELKRIVVQDDVVSLPSAMKWVPMEGFGAISSSKESFAIKTAAKKLTATPDVTLISTGYGQYAMKGVNKYASASGWDPTSLQGYQAKFILASLGCTGEKLAGVLKEASVRGFTKVKGLNFIPLEAEKLAKEVPKKKALVAKCAELRSNLLKEASYIDNAQTVDALLALNFVNPDNISKFVGKIGQLKSTISSLASLILASRVGLREVPEQAASAAMHRLIEVVDGLEALRATQEVQPS